MLSSCTRAEGRLSRVTWLGGDLAMSRARLQDEGQRGAFGSQPERWAIGHPARGTVTSAIVSLHPITSSLPLSPGVQLRETGVQREPCSHIVRVCSAQSHTRGDNRSLLSPWNVPPVVPQPQA